LLEILSHEGISVKARRWKKGIRKVGLLLELSGIGLSGGKRKVEGEVEIKYMGARGKIRSKQGSSQYTRSKTGLTLAQLGIVGSYSLLITVRRLSLMHN
jgi:hypothetical protein